MIGLCRRVLLFAFGAACLVTPAFAQSSPADGVPIPPDTDGAVYDCLWWNGAWVVAGTFSHIGGIPAFSVARWDGASWSAMDAGIGNGSFGHQVRALAVYQDHLIAAGSFRVGDHPQQNIAFWYQDHWLPLAAGIPFESVITSLAVYDGSLYAAGFGGHDGYYFPGYILRWDGAWHDDVGGGVGGEGASIHALASWDGALVAGGFFTTAGGIPCTNIARWNGSSWAPLGAGVPNGWVSALATSPEGLYAGGRFAQAGDLPARNVALWNGADWSPLGAGTDSTVRALEVDPAGVLAGGYFHHAGVAPASHVARFTETGWEPLDTGLPSNVLTIGIGPSEILAGYESGISRYDGSRWWPIDTAVSVGDEVAYSSLRLFPNPSHGPVDLQFLPRLAGIADVGVFDAAGRVVATLSSSAAPGVPVRFVWDGFSDRGLPVPAGTYWIRLTQGRGSSVESVVIVR